MAKVEIEIDDSIYEWLIETRQRVVKYGLAHPPQRVLTRVGTVEQLTHFSTNGLVVEAIPNVEITFPDWMPKRWRWICIDSFGIRWFTETEPVLGDKIWTGGGKSATLAEFEHFGFDISWVPAMPSGDWTKAKWRRRDA